MAIRVVQYTYELKGWTHKGGHKTCGKNKNTNKGGGEVGGHKKKTLNIFI
jgi:hypothetical protein